MEFPIGFPAHLVPRAEVAVLRACRQFSAGTEIRQRAMAGWDAFARIVVEAVGDGEIEIGLAPFLLEQFAYSLASDDPHLRAVSGFYFGRNMVSGLAADIRHSELWEFHMERLDELTRRKEPSEVKQSDRGETRKSQIMSLLKEKGMTRSKWASRAGVDPSVVYDYLEGKSSPRADTRKALAEAIGLDDLPE